MSDESNEETTAPTLEDMKSILSTAISSVREESRNDAISAVTEFAKEVSASRSRGIPVPKEEKRGDSVEVKTVRFLADGRENLYHRGRKGLDQDERAIYDGQCLIVRWNK